MIVIRSSIKKQLSTYLFASNQTNLMPQLLRLAVLACFCTAASHAWSIDRVYDMAGDNVSGDVVSTSKNGLKLKKGGNTQDFVAGNILKVMYQGDPPQLVKAREFAVDGQYEQALAELKNVNKENIDRKEVNADYLFYTVLCQSKLALSGKGDKKAAATAMFEFAKANQDTWHFYNAMKLLGDLALALNDHANALKYYKILASAPSSNTKIESVYLTGLVNLKKDAIPEATADFDKVIALQPQSPVAARLQTLAKAGKAVALARGGSGDEGLSMVKALIADLNPTDTEMAARIYNAQGASYEASGDKEGAIMAYLHTHLMFATQPDAHAEALTKLAELWPQVGKPERAAEARQELQNRYPGFNK